MVTPNDAIKKYGTPSPKNPCMTMFDLPFPVPHLPARLFCNKDLCQPLTQALQNLATHGVINEIKTFDGCFNIRQMRMSHAYSLHSWGIAIDLNAFENQMFSEGKLSPTFVKCFTDAGFHWGGNWKTRKDPMHFQLAKIWSDFKIHIWCIFLGFTPTASRATAIFRVPPFNRGGGCAFVTGCASVRYVIAIRICSALNPSPSCRWYRIRIDIENQDVTMFSSVL